MAKKNNKEFHEDYYEKTDPQTSLSRFTGQRIEFIRRASLQALFFQHLVTEDVLEEFPIGTAFIKLYSNCNLESMQEEFKYKVQLTYKNENGIATKTIKPDSISEEFLSKLGIKEILIPDTDMLNSSKSLGVIGINEFIVNAVISDGYQKIAFNGFVTSNRLLQFENLGTAIIKFPTKMEDKYKFVLVIRGEDTNKEYTLPEDDFTYEKLKSCGVEMLCIADFFTTTLNVVSLDSYFNKNKNASKLKKSLFSSNRSKSSNSVIMQYQEGKKKHKEELVPTVNQSEDSTAIKSKLTHRSKSEGKGKIKQAWLDSKEKDTEDKEEILSGSNAFTPRAEYILNNGKREITFGNQAHHYESQNKGQDVRKRSSSFGE